MRIMLKDAADKNIASFPVTPDNSLKKVSITSEMLAQAGGKLTLRCSVPIVDIHGYWHSELFRPVMMLAWQISLAGAGNRNTPFLTFFNQDSVNVFSIWLTDLIDDFEISASMNQEKCSYDIKIEIAITSETAGFETGIDTRNIPWNQAFAAFREEVVPVIPAYPAGAWLPVYCTWYAVHAALSMEYLERETRDAARLGFGTFIIDDGWSFADMKRVSPDTSHNWYENIGEWSVCEEKLPGFKAHVKRSQELGLNYLVWVAPFFIGRKNKYFNSAHKFLSEDAAGRKIIDAEDQELADYSLHQIIKLFEDYGLDGVKVDFLADIRSDVNAPHGRSAYCYIQKLVSGLRSIKADALIEFRQVYSTPATLGLATQFRATDTPFDFVENFHRIAQLRVILGDRVPVHADPAYWNIDESEINVARHLISSMAGVPMVSIDLKQLPESHRKLLKYYLSYYRENIEIFSKGHWEIEYEYSRVAYMKVTYGSREIIFLASKAYFSEAVEPVCTKHITVFNLDGSEINLPLHWNAFTLSGAPVKGNAIPVAGMGIVTGSRMV